MAPTNARSAYLAMSTTCRHAAMPIGIAGQIEVWFCYDNLELRGTICTYRHIACATRLLCSWRAWFRFEETNRNGSNSKALQPDPHRHKSSKLATVLSHDGCSGLSEFLARKIRECSIATRLLSVSPIPHPGSSHTG